MTIYNFSAGPAVLPKEVLQQVRDELVEWHGSGMSVMEMSHRGKEFMGIAAEAEADLREIMGIPANYKVLFLQGGASTQFSMIPMNLLRGKTGADYLNTGEWSKKAIKEAKKYCSVNVVASSEDKNFSYAPEQSAWKLNPDAAYVHYTSNETIGGVEMFWTPQTGSVPLVVDMSSHILSRPIDVSKFALIYAGAQKNIGPAGLTIVIVREDLIGQPVEGTPTMMDDTDSAIAPAESVTLIPKDIVPAFVVTALLLFALWELGHFQPQERVWLGALRRLKFLGLVLVAEEVHPDHGRRKKVSPVAGKIRLEAVID